MYTPSEKCPTREAVVQKGEGLLTIKDLADKESMYNNARMFSQIDINPGCSIGYHPHINETEFYYIIKGEGIFNDNGTEIPVHVGDVCATGYGEYHSLKNTGTELLSIIALIVLDK